MEYTLENLKKLTHKFIANPDLEKILDLPRALDYVILQTWFYNTPLLEEEERLFRRAYSDLRVNYGYFNFDK